MSLPRRLQTVIVFLLCSLPLCWLMVAAGSGNLGVNPTETLIRQLGEWALRFLLIALAATPVSRWLRWGLLLNYRRMLGLFAFVYACLHLISYLWFEHFFVWSELAEDLVKRPFITLGMAAWALLLPLALTSTRWAVKRLGFRRWSGLHRMVYPAVLLALIHFFLLVKADFREPLIYAGLLMVLLLARMPRRRKIRQRQPGITGIN